MLTFRLEPQSEAVVKSRSEGYVSGLRPARICWLIHARFPEEQPTTSRPNETAPTSAWLFPRRYTTHCGGRGASADEYWSQSAEAVAASADRGLRGWKQTRTQLAAAFCPG